MYHYKANEKYQLHKHKYEFPFIQ